MEMNPPPNLPELPDVHPKVRYALELAARIDTGQGCPAENHGIAVAAMEAITAIDFPQCRFGAASDQGRCQEPSTWRKKGSRLVWCSDHAASFKADGLEPIEAVRDEATESATPRTDAALSACFRPDAVDYDPLIDCARELETELRALEAEREGLRAGDSVVIIRELAFELREFVLGIMAEWKDDTRVSPSRMLELSSYAETLGVAIDAARSQSRER